MIFAGDSSSFFKDRVFRNIQLFVNSIEPSHVVDLLDSLFSLVAIDKPSRRLRQSENEQKSNEVHDSCDHVDREPVSGYEEAVDANDQRWRAVEHVDHSEDVRAAGEWHALGAPHIAHTVFEAGHSDYEESNSAQQDGWAE